MASNEVGNPLIYLMEPNNDSSEFDPLDRIVDAYVMSKRRGELPEIADYCDLLPERASEIARLLQTIEWIDQPARSPSQSAPSQIGAFEIVREIGRGRLGIVYEAIRESLVCRVALKVLSTRIDPSVVNRVQQIATETKRLQHRNIVPLLEVGEADGRWFLASQKFRGRALDTVIAGQRVSGANASKRIHADGCKLVAKIGLQVAQALDHAHQFGLLHGDIKPSNLLLEETGTTRITDFGLARGMDNTGGTLRYAAPENASGKYDARSDLYSLGLTLYELLALRPAFRQSDRLKLEDLATGYIPRRIESVNPEVPGDITTIVMKSIESDPIRRYQSAREMATDLQRFIDGQPIELPAKRSRWSFWLKRRR